jgi:hypothetical protein
MSMSKHCQAIVGYLVPRRSCQNLPDTRCSQCQTEICHSHSKIDISGVLCTACALPAALKGFELKNEIWFSPEDLATFSETWRRQKSAKGGWVDFT